MEKTLLLTKKELGQKLGIGRYAVNNLIKTKLCDAVVNVGQRQLYNFKTVNQLLSNKKAKTKSVIGQQILAEFNKIASSKYKNIKSINLIENLLEMGYIKEDILLVAEHKVYEADQFNGFPCSKNPVGFPKKYISPRTLYNPEKFESYLKSARGALNE